jgi:hypothetical protein
MKGQQVIRKGTIGPRMLVEDSFHALSLFGILYVCCRVVYCWNGQYVRLTFDADELEPAYEPINGRLAANHCPRPDGADVGRG